MQENNEETYFEEVDLFSEIDVDQFLIDLPKLKKKKNQFLIKIDWEEDETIYVGVRELLWHEMLQAETLAFRIKTEDEMYLAGEHERREILKKAILWVATIPSCEIMHNESGQILSHLNFDVVEAIWSQYQTYIFLGATEAAALYNAAVKYYTGDSQTNSPVPPMVLEVDLMLKFGGFSRKELRKITATEMERMQTIFMARAEALGLGVRKQTNYSRGPELINDGLGGMQLNEEMLDTMPPGAREMAGQFLGGPPPPTR
jgi:hypothetical protein